VRFSMRWDRSDAILLAASGQEVDLGDINAAWVRHMDPAACLPGDMDPGHREAARVICDHAVWALLESLDAFQLDPPAGLLAVPRNPGQLKLARRHGLDIPRTLVTSDPSAALKFVRSCRRGAIVKMLDSAAVAMQTSTGSAPWHARAVT